MNHNLKNGQKNGIETYILYLLNNIEFLFLQIYQFFRPDVFFFASKNRYIKFKIATF